MGGSLIPDEYDKVILEWIEHGWRVIISKFSQISKIALLYYFDYWKFYYIMIGIWASDIIILYQILHL